MFWRKNKEERVAEPVQQDESVIDAPPAEFALEEKAEQASAAPIAREPVAEPDDVAPGIRAAQLEGRVIEAISTIYDPEIPVNIYELGLIYDLHITVDGCVRVEMTLTSPACPVAGSLPGEVEEKVREVQGVQDVALELVWDPPWTPDRMSEAARLELGFM